MGDDDVMGCLFVNPIILMPKNDYVKLVIDARYLNSVTDITNYSWPFEPVQMIMIRVNCKMFSGSDLSCAYHQVPLSPERKSQLVSRSVESSTPIDVDSMACVDTQTSSAS